MDSTGLPPPSPQQQNQSQGYDEEKIVIKRPTELISDEYGHRNAGELSFHVFGDQDDSEIVNLLATTAVTLGCNFDPNRNIHDMNDIRTGLNQIANESAEKSALIIFFVGVFDKEGTLLTRTKDNQRDSVEMKEIWNRYSSSLCHQLKEKPKIFIFCTSKYEYVRGTEIDSRRHYTITPEKAYDFPAESDMLIVYKKCNETDHNSAATKLNFIRELCKNILNYSQKHDITDIITYTQSQSEDVFMPLIISTLTRKFYLTANSHREHFLSIRENSSVLDAALNQLKTAIEKLRVERQTLNKVDVDKTKNTSAKSKKQSVNQAKSKAQTGAKKDSKKSQGEQRRPQWRP